MTVLCGGGVSGPKPGVAETIIFTAGALASVLNNKGGAWATLAAPLLGVLTYQAEALCENDPPADPNLTAADYLALLSLNDWPAVQAALAKLADLVKIAVWYELCECKTIATPAAPPALFTPPGGVQTQPVVSGPCWSYSTAYEFPYGDGNNGPRDFNVFIFPQSQVVNVTSTFWTGIGKYVPLPSGWTHGKLRLESLDTGNGTNWARQRLSLFGANNTTATQICAASGTLEVGRTGDSLPHATVAESPMFAFSPTCPYWTLSSTRFGTDTGPMLVRVTFDAFCGLPGGSSGNCCSDPAVLALLQQVLQLVTVTQRQAAPFGYVPAGDVAGLTGNGVYVIDTPLVAATLLLTTIPIHYGMAEGEPDRHFDVGWVSRGTVDGMEPPRPIRTSPFMMRLEGHHTRIGYSLAPGVVATLRLHQREP